MTFLADLPVDWHQRYRLKLRHLVLLVALDVAKNLNRAADAIGLLHPAASKLLTELESRLGTALFDRHARGMRANIYGEVLIRQSRSILASLDRARDELRSLARGDMGEVSIGSADAPAVTLLDACRPFAREAGARVHTLRRPPSGGPSRSRHLCRR